MAESKLTSCQFGSDKIFCRSPDKARKFDFLVDLCGELFTVETDFVYSILFINRR